jgi:hypothetical protein
MAKSNRHRKLDRAKAEHKRAEDARLRAEAEMRSEASRRVDAIFQRNVDLRLSAADMAKLLVGDPDNLDSILVREDARAASLKDRLRLMVDSFPEGPPPGVLIFASVAAHLAGNDSEKRRYEDALSTFLRSPAGQEWQDNLRIERVADEYPRDLMHRIYLHVVADARQRAIEDALAADEPVGGLSAVEFLGLLRQYASRPSGADRQLTARVRARLAEPMSDFLFDQAVNVAMDAMFHTLIESLLEHAQDSATAPDETR